MNDSKSTTKLPLGVSCEVWIERDANGNEIVVKQPLAKLKVAADWRSNPERFRVEARALEVLRELLGERAAPKMLWIDDARQCIAMERIDPTFRNWKTELLAGRVSPQVAERVGQALGLLHTRSAARRDLTPEFASKVYFEELRIEPFFERVAAVNPPLADGIRSAIEFLRGESRALVHGDFSPKNLLVRDDEVVILDLEIAHWGNPRFDIAFLVSHLVLKGLRRGAAPIPFAVAIREFVGAYREHGFPALLGAELVRILGCLLLARLEGASPVDYRDELDAEHVKRVASELIRNPTNDILRAANQALRLSLANE